MTKERILVFDDDICWEEQLQKELSRSGIYIESVEKLSTFQSELKAKRDYQAVIIFLEQIEKELSENLLEELIRQQNIPVFCLDSKENIEKEVALLKLGVADYFWKDEDIRVTAARVIARIFSDRREVEKEAPEVIEDADTYTICVGKRSISFTRLEFQMFHILWQACGKVVSRETLYEELWNGKDTKDMRVVDTTVKRLRHKLKETQLMILTRYRLGYILINKALE